MGVWRKSGVEKKKLIQRKRLSQAIEELTITNPTFITSGGNSRAHVKRNEVYGVKRLSRDEKGYRKGGTGGGLTRTKDI